MRFVSSRVDGYRIHAVSGTNTVSFAIDFDPGQVAGLLGFAVEREDPTENERYYMAGFKVFEEVYPNPTDKLRVSTYDQPVQSFVWDDFTAKPGREYVYRFHPLKGLPKNLDRSGREIAIRVRTEPLWGQTHGVYFNRGVASSQAYADRFGNQQPDKITDPAKQQQALDWLSRDLDEALFRFIDQAGAGDILLGAFYEFRYRPAADRLKAAIGRGVTVKLVIDAKDNSYTDGKGKFHEAFPRKDNKDMVKDAGLPASAITWREHSPDDIAHNKFLVLLRGPGTPETATPAEVWTGSTNLSVGGIHGQTNVGHWLRDGAAAAHYRDYWKLLARDPGAWGDDKTANRKAVAKVRSDVAALLVTPTDRAGIAAGVTPVFSPRSGSDVLDMYAALVDKPQNLGCITLAFGISKVFKDRLTAHTGASSLSFLLLEKKDVANANAKTPFVRLGARQNVYQAWGAYLKDPIYQWTRETNARGLGLNTHVAYIHSKFLLHDPLGADPIVVTGSANFSDASTNDNDENMLLIRGETRVADIYFTEFNRLFFHYYFRSVHEEIEARRAGAAGSGNAAADDKASLFIDGTDAWLQKYKPGSLRRKRVDIFTAMSGAVTLPV